MPRRLLCRLFLLACAVPLQAAADAPAAPLVVAMAAAAPTEDVLAGWRGKPLLVNFWATWCTPCRAEIPALVDAYESRGADAPAMVGVALEDDVEGVRQFAAAHEIGYPQLAGKERALALMRALGNERQAVPYTVAIDSSGKVVARKFGILRRGDLERMLLALRTK